LYNEYGLNPPAKEKLKHFSGVETNLFYLVSLLLENDRELLEKGDFVEQVMNQYDGQPGEMMHYAEGIISDRADVARNDIESTPLQITGPPAIIGIDDGDNGMDTTRDSKRRREPVLRQQSKIFGREEN
jgi:hypothetical protein